MTNDERSTNDAPHAFGMVSQDHYDRLRREFLDLRRRHDELAAGIERILRGVREVAESAPSAACDCLPCYECGGDRVVCRKCGRCARHQEHAPDCPGCGFGLWAEACDEFRAKNLPPVETHRIPLDLKAGDWHIDEAFVPGVRASAAAPGDDPVISSKLLRFERRVRWITTTEALKVSFSDLNPLDPDDAGVWHPYALGDLADPMAGPYPSTMKIELYECRWRFPAAGEEER